MAIFAMSLMGCSAIELAHEPVDCLGQPQVSLNLTRDEANLFTDDMRLKMRKFAVTLRERINTQCNINKEHDELHN